MAVVRIWDYEVSAIIKEHNFDYEQCVDAFTRLGLTFEVEQNNYERISVLTVNLGWTNFAVHKDERLEVTLLDGISFGKKERELYKEYGIKAARVDVGMGVQRNCSAVIKDVTGKWYLKLSPIADPTHTGEVKRVCGETKNYFIRRFESANYGEV